MSHGPAANWGEDKAISYKTKLGILLVLIYAVVYFGFIIINTLFPKAMGIRVLWGVNLAVMYGFGLILFAVILGVIYNLLCSKMETILNKTAKESTT